MLLFLHRYLAGGHELICYVHDMIEYGLDHSIRHRWAHGGRACLCHRAISDPAPHLEDGVPLVRIAQENHLGVRTVYRWAENYRERGLAGLSRKARGDKSKRQMSPTLEKVIEGLALKEPRRPQPRCIARRPCWHRS